MSKKQSAIVICPGRGTYNQTELGYLAKYYSGKVKAEKFLGEIDKARRGLGQTAISELDSAERFSAREHATSENASPLIYACALSDYRSIDLDRYEIVAITGNSMGWYLALACAGVLRGTSGFELVNTMGRLMQTQGCGAQVIYPLVNAQWQLDPQLVQVCEQTVAEVNADKNCHVYSSIRLGGMQVLAGNDAGITALLEKLPKQQERYPFQLYQHSAFHSPLLEHIPELAQAELDISLFNQAELPLIDGNGKIWQPGATNMQALYDYTLNRQIIQTYDFSSAVEVAIKEFAPDKLIVLGPGTTLGPPVAQSLIRHRWLGLTSKSEFTLMQKNDPFVLSMGIDAQRSAVVQTQT